jgi:predicted RNase H-like HicB family nuclease
LHRFAGVWGTTLGKDSRDVIRELEADGWCFIGANGSHHHFKHPIQAGQSDHSASSAGLASEDAKVDLSSGGLKGRAVTAMPSYIALVHKDNGTSYGVSFPDVPGCISAGDTFEEAITNAAEVAMARHQEREPLRLSAEPQRADFSGRHWARQLGGDAQRYYDVRIPASTDE